MLLLECNLNSKIQNLMRKCGQVAVTFKCQSSLTHSTSFQISEQKSLNPKPLHLIAYSSKGEFPLPSLQSYLNSKRYLKRVYSFLLFFLLKP